MLQALIKVLLREVRGTHRQWGSTDNQFGAAMNYFYSKYQSCMTTLLLKLETAKGWKKGGKTEYGINLRDNVVYELLLLSTAQGSSFSHSQSRGPMTVF